MRPSSILYALPLTALFYTAPSSAQAAELASADLHVGASKPVYVCAQHRTHAKQASATRKTVKANTRS